MVHECRLTTRMIMTLIILVWKKALIHCHEQELCWRRISRYRDQALMMIFSIYLMHINIKEKQILFVKKYQVVLFAFVFLQAMGK